MSQPYMALCCWPPRISSILSLEGQIRPNLTEFDRIVVSFLPDHPLMVVITGPRLIQLF